MFTYQLRERVFRLKEGESLLFPNSVELLITLGPPQPFGASPEGGRTAVMESKAHIEFNANVGQHSVVSDDPLTPLDVTLEEPNRLWKLRGNVLQVVLDRCDTNQELTQFILSLFYGLPILLNVEFADPPVIEQIKGKVGDTGFNWELARWHFSFRTTSQDHQETKVLESWKRLELLSSPGNARLLGALQYFHVASRLNSAGHSPWEFTAEILLNLTKTLEILFPPSGDGQTRNAARDGLSALGYSSDEIERNFLPAMALRSEIDVGHVDLSLYTQGQLNAVHTYTEFAKTAWSDMLRSLMKQMADGAFVLNQYVPSSADSRAKRIIEQIERHFGDDVFRR